MSDNSKYITVETHKRKKPMISKQGVIASLIVVILAISTFFAFYFLMKNPFPTQPKIEQYNKAINKVDSLEKLLKDQKQILDTLLKISFELNTIALISATSV